MESKYVIVGGSGVENEISVIRGNYIRLFMFQFQDSKMEQLIDHLNSYGKHGIPQLLSVDEDLEEGEIIWTRVESS